MPRRVSSSNDASDNRRDKTHEDYNEADADIVLKANDDVLFRVHSFVLKASSSFFHDLLRSPNIHVGPEPEDSIPVPIDATSQTLKVFLDLMRNIPEPKTLSPFEVLKAIPGMMDGFGCHSIQYRLIHRLKAYTHTHPWDVFVIAARFGDMPLARKSVESMDVSLGGLYSFGLTKVTDEMAKSVPLPYLMALVRAVWRYKKSTSQSWHGVAAYFQIQS
ncbi:hypothetical protein BD324DRAFT_634474 [Kockovaella imperatae]|uniref:BTB domain-containing protein n=1 Tax=Kockovaella imperatae TaxID=4999 RepID=A0A1Y1U9H0_9TREE|nr:hypothetical protein BD324DRAFT_634474 [Kockovaella imperatae]ORX34681.1 hypothetical protein BD324DRAFT_634474 [Kockovaella imperatae]